MFNSFIISVAYPDDPVFEKIVCFANKVCSDRVSMQIRRRADLFVYAHIGAQIIGSLGLHRGDTNPELIFEMCDPPDAFKRLVHTSNPNRSLLAEFGTRAVSIPSEIKIKSRDVSIAMTAVLVPFAHQQGIKYLGCVSNPLLPAIAKSVGINMMVLGKPDYSHKDEDFQRNMERFARTKQVCYGYKIESIDGCINALSSLEQAGILQQQCNQAR